MKIHPESTPNRRKIDLGPFWVPKAVSGTRPDALGMAFGRPNAAPKPILGRPRRAKSGQEPSKSVPGPPRRRSKTLPVSRSSASGAPSGFKRTLGSIFVAFVLSRGSSDVPRASVFTVFCWVRTKLAPNVHERRQTSKIEPFCPPKSSPGASAGPKIEPKRPRSSEETRPKCPRGRRKFFSRRERGNCERESASSAPEVRADLRVPRVLISESLNGLRKQISN